MIPWWCWGGVGVVIAGGVVGVVGVCGLLDLSPLCSPLVTTAVHVQYRTPDTASGSYLVGVVNSTIINNTYSLSS